MKHIKILTLLSLLFCLYGCQKSESMKYVVYNMDEELSRMRDSQNDFERPDAEFGSSFSLPVRQTQLEVLKEKYDNIWPLYNVDNSTYNDIIEENSELKSSQFYINQNLSTNYYVANISLFPYTDEKELDKISKKYVGEIDPQKEYIYISDSLASTSAIMHDDSVQSSLHSLLEEEYTDEYSIKVTMTVPVKAINGEGYLNINYVDYGPYDGIYYEEIEVEKEYYIKGVISDKSNYKALSTCYIDSKLIDPLYSMAKDVEPPALIVESSSKDIEKTFKELGLRYYKLTK